MAIRETIDAVCDQCGAKYGGPRPKMTNDCLLPPWWAYMTLQQAVASRFGGGFELEAELTKVICSKCFLQLRRPKE